LKNRADIVYDNYMRVPVPMQGERKSHETLR
jgi:hypothetical protein